MSNEKIVVSNEWTSDERALVAATIRTSLQVLTETEPAWVLNGSQPDHIRTRNYRSHKAWYEQCILHLETKPATFLEANRTDYSDWVTNDWLESRIRSNDDGGGMFSGGGGSASGGGMFSRG